MGYRTIPVRCGPRVTSALILVCLVIAAGLGTYLFSFATGQFSIFCTGGSLLTGFFLLVQPACQVCRGSQLATRTIRQNLFFAFLYNVTAIPLAVSGLLNPLVAVTAMFGSSFTVIGNALRITWMKQARPLADPQRQVSEAGAGGIV